MNDVCKISVILDVICEVRELNVPCRSGTWLSKSEVGGGGLQRTLVSQTEREDIPVEELTRSFCEIVNRPLVVAPAASQTLGTSRSREAI